MKILGIDYGDARIGLALSDDLQVTAQGYGVVNVKKTRDVYGEIAAIARAKGVTLFVVGMPRNMNGSYGERAEVTRAFGEKLTAATGIPVEWVDERLTTVSVNRVLVEGNVSRGKRKQVVDKLAAVLILQTYLDRNGRA